MIDFLILIYCMYLKINYISFLYFYFNVHIHQRVPGILCATVHKFQAHEG